MTSCKVSDGSDESSQDNERSHIYDQPDAVTSYGQPDLATSYSQPDFATSLNEKEFSIYRRIPGNDALNVPRCVANDTLCDLCLFFVASSLSKQHEDDVSSISVYGYYSSSRALRNSARTGCKLYVTILESLPLVYYDRMVLVQSDRSQTGVAKFIDALSITIQYYFGLLQQNRFAFKITPLGDLLQKLVTVS